MATKFFSIFILKSKRLSLLLKREFGDKKKIKGLTTKQGSQQDRKKFRRKFLFFFLKTGFGFRWRAQVRRWSE